MKELSDLLTTYSVAEIFLFVIALAAAIKGVVTFWDWGYERLKKKFRKDIEDEDFESKVMSKFEGIATQIDSIRISHQDDKNEIVSQIKNVTIQHTLDKQELIGEIQKTKETMEVLLASDKDDIKSWITEKHHYFCYEKKVIDDYSLDCIEKRYQHYVDEGGNSYVATLMKDIRALPKVSMIRDEDK